MKTDNYTRNYSCTSKNTIFLQFLLKSTILVISVIFIPSYNCLALNDNEYNKMMTESEGFRKADNDLTLIWKSLRKKMKGEFKDKTLNDQRYWVRSGRDEVAKEFMKAGLSKNNAYTRATIRRIHELQAIEYNLNLSEHELERGMAKADTFFYTEEDDPSFFSRRKRKQDAANTYMNYTEPQRAIPSISSNYSYNRKNHNLNEFQLEEYLKSIGAKNNNSISTPPTNTPQHENVRSDELIANYDEYKHQRKRNDPRAAALMGGVKGAAFAIFACLLSVFIMVFMWIFKRLKNKSKILLAKSIERSEREEDFMQKENTGTIQKWYNNMTKAQRMYVYIVSCLLIFVYGIGLIPLSVLIYCKLGTRKSNGIDTTFNDKQYDEKDENNL